MGHRSEKDKKQQRRLWLVRTDNDFEGGLQKKCLISAIAIGFHHREKTKEDEPEGATFDCLRKHRTNRSAAKSLLGLVLHLQSEIGLSDNDCQRLDIVLPLMSDYLACQFIVYGERRGEILQVCPQTFDPTLRPIFLLLSRCRDGTSHVDLIICRRGLKRDLGIQCYKCRAFLHSKTPFHYCKEMVCCKACRRPIRKADYFQCSKENRDFCDSEISDRSARTCHNCGVTCWTNDCWRAHGGHRRQCVSLGWKCGKCQVFTSSTSGFEKKSAIKSAHECGVLVTRCKDCGKRMTTEDLFLAPLHQCSLSKVKSPEQHPKHAFIFSHFSENQISIDKRVHEFAAAHCLIYEIERTVFKRVIYLDGGEVVEEESVMKLDYIPSSINEACKLSLAKETKQSLKGRKLRARKFFTQSCAKAKGSLGATQSMIAFMAEKFHEDEFVIVCEGQRSLYEILQKLVDLSINVKISGDNTHLYSVGVPAARLKFLCKKNYLPSSLCNLRNMFGLEIPYLFYPVRRVRPGENMTPRHFNYDFLESEEKKEFDTQWRSGKVAHEGQNNLIEFLRTRAEILASGLLLYTRDVLLFQNKVNSELEGKSSELKRECAKVLFLPFSSPCTTAASLSYALLKKYCFNIRNDVHLLGIDEDKGTYNFRSSKGEMELVLFKASQFQGRTVYHSFSSRGQNTSFRGCYPDLFVEEENGEPGFALFYNGCIIHVHSLIDSNCPMKLEGPQNPVTKLKNSEVLKRDQEKMAAFEASLQGKNVKIEIVFECQFEQMKREDDDLRRFLQRPEMRSTTKRLTPRNFMLGGRVESFALRYCENESNFSLTGIDSTSHYPSLLMNENYPVGKGFSVLEPEIGNVCISEKGDNLIMNGEPVFGFVQATIRIDKHAFLPFVPLPDTHPSRSSPIDTGERPQPRIFANCHGCIRSRSPVCRHKADHHRLTTQTFTVPELLYAIKEGGCELVCLLEGFFYKEEAKLFRDYLGILCREKIRHSEIDEAKSDLQSYLGKINRVLFPAEPLQEIDLKPNMHYRSAIKFLTTSIFGKLLGSKSRRQTVVVYSQEQLRKYMETEDIQGVNILNQDALELSILPQKKNIRRQLSSNYIYGAYCIAYSRIKMHSVMQKLHSLGKKLFYTDCDSFYVGASLSELKTLLPFSQAPGHFQSVIPNGYRISQLRSLGSRMLALEIREGEHKSEERQEGDVRLKIWCRGLSLASRGELSFQLYDDFLKSRFVGEKKEKIVNVKQKGSRKHLLSDHCYHITSHTITNSVNLGRVCCQNDPNYTTVPFGFVPRK